MCSLSSQAELPSNIKVRSLSSREVTAQLYPPWRIKEKSWTASRAPGTSFRAGLGRFLLQWFEAAASALLQPHASESFERVELSQLKCAIQPGADTVSWSRWLPGHLAVQMPHFS